MNKNSFKVKHLDLIVQDELDFVKILVEVFGYKNTWFNKLFSLRSMFIKANGVLDELRLINFEKLTTPIGAKIKPPKNIDSLSFQCRLDLSNVNGSYTQKVVDTIAMATYKDVHKATYKKGKLYDDYRKHISNKPLVEMLGVYNDIVKSIDDSNRKWEMLFLQVNVVDKHYEQANGKMWLGRFDLLKTQKKLYEDFGEGLKTAFDLPYDLVQWNNLESASQAYVHDLMSKSKEREMRINRR